MKIVAMGAGVLSVVMIALAATLWREPLEVADQRASVISLFVGAVSLLVSVVSAIAAARSGPAGTNDGTAKFNNTIQNTGAGGIIVIGDRTRTSMRVKHSEKREGSEGSPSQGTDGS